MNRSFSLNLFKIKKNNWQCPSEFSFVSDKIQFWLSEQGSLSVLLKAHCHTLSVDLLDNTWVDYRQLKQDEKELLPQERRYLVRQVILKGDGKSWVFGYSVIPESTALNNRYDLSNIGELPLGDTIFRANKVERDALMMSEVADDPRPALYARRSRLWMEERPMLVTELFLSDSPMYS